jgi:diguanylate cyclase (GGDEF)-like protein/PAS domain S-box-containing protein
MTERRRFERQLGASQAQLQAITDHLPALVARFDRDVRYVYANPRSREMASGIDLIGKSLPDLRGPKHYAQFKPYVDAALRGEAQEFETWLETSSGRIELRAQFVPDRTADGRVQGFYSMSFDITASKAAERELERQARVDALTGLANRRHFEEDLSAAVARATRTGAALLALSLDLDRFKQINDSLGHAVGDEVLKEFARRVRASVYDVDLVARLGGDEFVVLVEYAPTAEAGERIARHLLDAMVPPFEIDGRDVPVATSVGIGLHQPVVSAAALMALADKALYEAKARGRNTWSLCRG